MFSDPTKLLPLLGYIGVFGALWLGKMTSNEAMMAVAAIGAMHAGISSVNNVNPPKQ